MEGGPGGIYIFAAGFAGRKDQNSEKKKWGLYHLTGRAG